MKLNITPEMDAVLRRSGSGNYNESLAGTHELAVALVEPLRAGVLVGDNLAGIFEVENLAPDAAPEYPLDLLAPGKEKDFVAYTIPNHGRIPERHVEGDYVMVPTFSVGNSIDWLLKYARSTRWPVVARATEVFRAGFVQKNNNDGWSVLIAAGYDRNIVVYDGDAAAGQFTKRVVSLGKTTMRRNGGGNSTSTNRGELTDLYVSPEAAEDMRDWKVDQVDEVTRREIFVAPDGMFNRIFGVNIHVLDELGEGQEYQTYFTGDLGGSLATSDVELMVGLDLRNRDSFVNPVRQALEVFEDPTLHRSQRAGIYGWMEHGWGALDNRRVILLSC